MKICNIKNYFPQTHLALISGGPAPMDLKSETFRTLPATNDKDILEKLLKVKSEWEPIEKNIIENIKSGEESSLKYIIAHNEILLDKINDSVYALQLRSEKNNLIIRIIIACSFFMISTLLLINLIKRVKELRIADDRIKELEKLLPICSSCKKIRIDNEKPTDPNSWKRIEEYLHVNKEMLFTHSICPDCVKKLYPGLLEGIKK